jgi:CMP-N,N'-diacetyllegionaminic acid synthase
MSVENCYYLIPARKGSKGFPLKNRKLFEYTAKTFPEHMKDRLYVSTDDEFIKEAAKEFNINVINRPEELAQDDTSMKDVVLHFKDSLQIESNCDIVLLYLTYPQRTWADIVKIYEYFSNRQEKSLVCCEDVKEHPYLCFHLQDSQKADLLIDHSLYRRQDYPKCVKMSMFVACYEASIIEELHDLMFESNTIFYKLQQHKVDVDYLEQFLMVNEEVN